MFCSFNVFCGAKKMPGNRSLPCYPAGQAGNDGCNSQKSAGNLNECPGLGDP